MQMKVDALWMGVILHREKNSNFLVHNKILYLYPQILNIDNSFDLSDRFKQKIAVLMWNEEEMSNTKKSEYLNICSMCQFRYIELSNRSSVIFWINFVGKPLKMHSQSSPIHKIPSPKKSTISCHVKI